MADLSFGSTFQPDDQSRSPWQRPGAQGGGGASGGAGFSPVQQAVKVLSLRLPQVFGAQAPISPGLMRGGMQSHVGPTQQSAVAQSIVGRNQGQAGYGAGAGYAPPPIPQGAAGALANLRKKIPGAMQQLPGEAANLGHIISQLPHNIPLPNISMIRPGGGGYPTQLPRPQLPQAPAYAPAYAPPQPPQPTIVPIGAAGPNGNVYTGPPAQGPQNTGSYAPYGGGYAAGYGGGNQGPYFRSPYA